MDAFITPVLPRGRGVLCTDDADNREAEHSRISANGCTVRGKVEAHYLLL